MATEIDPMPLNKAMTINGSFSDYPKFEGEAGYRQRQKAQFIGGEVWAPAYDYPGLTTLRDIDDSDGNKPTMSEIKHDLQGAVFSLEVAKQRGDLDQSIAELYKQYYETR